MKKIIHIQVIPKMTGAQKVSFDILSNISSEYDKYIMFGSSYDVDDDFIKKFEDNNIKIVFFDNLKRDIGSHDFRCFFGLYSYFKLNNFDIIHTNSTKPGILARIAAKLSGCKSVIHTVHGISFHKFTPLHKRFFFWFLEYISSFFSDTLISVNNYYLKYYPIIKNKKVIHNTLNFTSTKKIKNLSSIITIGFLSRLDYQKDPITLLKAIKFINDEHYEYINKLKVIFGGDGDLLGDCKEFVRDNNLENVIEFIGWVDNKDLYFDSIDVFCLPSIFEAFGLVFLEAGLYSKPTIATNVEGIPEVIIDNETGFLVSPKDYEDLGRKIMYFIDNPDCILSMGKRANENIKKTFSFENMIYQYEAIYNEI